MTLPTCNHDALSVITLDYVAQEGRMRKSLKRPLPYIWSNSVSMGGGGGWNVPKSGHDCEEQAQLLDYQ